MDSKYPPLTTVKTCSGTKAPYGYNLVAVLSPDKEKVLMCKRTKDPYKGKYNLFGGKVEANEIILNSAYRELAEETSITNSDITLYHLLDTWYYSGGYMLYVFYGILKDENIIKTRKIHDGPYWFSINATFYDDRFAGEGNIYHMIEQIKLIEEIKPKW